HDLLGKPVPTFPDHAPAAGEFHFARNRLMVARVVLSLSHPYVSESCKAMALSSMTGFARSQGASGPYTFEWDLKSVNAKRFDLRLRLPPGWDDLEAAAKKRAGELLSRGTVYANLNVKRANSVSAVRINEDVLASIVKVAHTLSGKIDAV